MLSFLNVAQCSKAVTGSKRHPALLGNFALPKIKVKGYRTDMKITYYFFLSKNLGFFKFFSRVIPESTIYWFLLKKA